MKTLVRTVLVGVITLHGLSQIARAGTNGFVVPPWRGSAGSTSGYWETFSVATGAPGNHPDRPGASTGATLIQADTNAFLTGSGNIYNLTGISVFTLTDTTPGPVGTVVVQTRTIGSELHQGSAMLSWTDNSGLHSLAPQIQAELNRGSQPGLGATVSMLWQWDLSGLAVTQYTISFQAGAPSLSFDALTFDTFDQATPLFTRPFAVNDANPAIDRWMYANNASPCDRPAGSVFATFGDEAGVDTRHAQHMVGWNTASRIPPGQGSARYQITRCRVTLTINRGLLFAYDPSQDPLATYFAPGHPGFQPDPDVGRPVELFGVGFRNGYDDARFDQCSEFGSNETGQRNAYAAGWSTQGRWVDVSNNVGKTNAALAPFEVAPFAIGQTTNALPGQLVPAGARMTFDLNLADPFVLSYVQASLNAGRLRLMVSSLHTSAGQFGAPNYPDFATRFNEAILEPTRLELDGLVVGDGDLDADGLPDDWELFALRTLTFNANEDPDGDGRSNRAEYQAGTDPLSAGSALRILSVTRAAAGQSIVRHPSVASRQYQVEFTEDLDRWTPLTNPPVFELDTGVAVWRDTMALGSHRFYRVRGETVRP